MVKDKQRRFSKLEETIKNMILGFLVLSLILLVIVYIGGTHIYQNMTNNVKQKPFDKIWIVQSDVSTAGLDSERLIPEFIGYKLSTSKPCGSIADRVSAIQLYDIVKPCLNELFGSGSYCTKLESYDGEQLMRAAASSSEFIYLRYHEPVMYQLIYAYSSSKLIITDEDVAKISGDDTSVYISELFILPDNDVAAHRFVAYASDGEGRYFEFRLDESQVASSFHIAKLAESGTSISTHEFEFTSDRALMYTQPEISAEIEAEIIASEPIDLTDDDFSDDLLRMFGYNPGKHDSHVGNGIVTYVDLHSVIQLGKGELLYQANNAEMGVRLDSLLGYSVDGALSLYDKLMAVDNLISRIGDLSRELIGKDASLCLGDVYNDGGMLVFEYVVTYNNILISDKPAVRAVLDKDWLNSFELSAISYSGMDQYVLSLRQGYVLRKLRETGQLDNSAENGRMRYIYREGKAEWSLLLPVGKNE
ncbi:MAG: hypothetical protein HFE63_06080 [Clostridiales bacterium]|nr:hypothetical protein [Clostridiales bacterium]